MGNLVGALECKIPNSFQQRREIQQQQKWIFLHKIGVRSDFCF